MPSRRAATRGRIAPERQLAQLDEPVRVAAFVSRGSVAYQSLSSAPCIGRAVMMERSDRAELDNLISAMAGLTQPCARLSGSGKKSWMVSCLWLPGM